MAAFIFFYNEAKDISSYGWRVPDFTKGCKSKTPASLGIMKKLLRNFFCCFIETKDIPFAGT